MHIEEESRAEAQKLVALLSHIDMPDIGLSPTVHAVSFPPVLSSAQLVSGVLGHTTFERYPAVTRLVELGPFALDVLLEHLSDSTPTGLMIADTTLIMASEFPSNPCRDGEKDSTELFGLSSLDQAIVDRSNHVQEYRVTVGDVCFVLIGMIVNRPYCAVRYQPSGLAVVNSPVMRPQLAQAVRFQWQSIDDLSALCTHLAADFACEESEILLQIGAATRLLYYCPDKGAPLVASRLRRLSSKSLSNATVQEDRRNAMCDALVDAVSWCSNDVLNAVLREVAGGGIGVTHQPSRIKKAEGDDPE